MVNTENIREALQSVRNPHGEDTQDIRDQVDGVFFSGHTVHCVLKAPVSAEWRTAIEKTISTLVPFRHVKILIAEERPAPKPEPDTTQDTEINPDAGVGKVKHIVAVASGKGGVGKSTVTANLAITLSRMGSSVGLLDADIYGPSMPMMLGANDRPESVDGKVMLPVPAYGLKTLSIGNMLGQQQDPVIWRGPMVHSALQQMLGQTLWGELDVLLIDMPPGTGDVALTLAQRGRLSGAVIVTTPQNIALADARKAIGMFRKVDVPILGIIENMAFHVCPNCQTKTAIFGSEGGKIEAKNQQVTLLGRLPLQSEVCRQADFGRPIVLESAQYAEDFQNIAENLQNRLSE